MRGWRRRTPVVTRVAREDERVSCCCMAASRIHIYMILLSQLVESARLIAKASGPALGATLWKLWICEVYIYLYYY